MEISLDRVQEQNESAEAVMRHNGESLRWTVALFEKIERSSKFSPDFDVFEQINGYWKYLPQSTQDKIFDVYKRMWEVFDNVWDISELTKQLPSLIEELYRYHGLNEIRHWIDFHSMKNGHIIVIPARAEVYDSFEQLKEQHQHPPERTFLKHHYWDLVTLSVAVRAMIPIWGQFIYRARKRHSTALKEYYAFRLLANSSVYRSPPMEHLRIFVEHTIPQDKSRASAYLDSLSSEDFPMWIFSMVVVRRLCMGDIRGIDPDSSLVKFIFKYIGQKVKSQDGNFLGLVKDKAIEGSSSSSEGDNNNLSKLEGYKIKQDIADGDIVSLGYIMQGGPEVQLAVARRICPDLPAELLQQSRQTVQLLATQQIRRAQMILMQWVMCPVIRPKGLLHLPKHQVLDAMAITQACLWHRKHHELAGLVSAIARTDSDEITLSGSEHKTRIPKEMIEELQQLYPYARRPSGKARTQRPPSVAVVAIEAMVNKLSEFDWRLTLAPEHVQILTGNKNARSYAAPPDIKVLLARLSISLAKRTF